MGEHLKRAADVARDVHHPHQLVVPCWGEMIHSLNEEYTSVFVSVPPLHVMSHVMSTTPISLWFPALAGNHNMLSTFGADCPQNGAKNMPHVPWDTPTMRP